MWHTIQSEFCYCEPQHQYVSTSPRATFVSRGVFHPDNRQVDYVGTHASSDEGFHFQHKHTHKRPARRMKMKTWLRWNDMKRIQILRNGWCRISIFMQMQDKHIPDRPPKWECREESWPFRWIKAVLWGLCLSDIWPGHAPGAARIPSRPAYQRLGQRTSQLHSLQAATARLPLGRRSPIVSVVSTGTRYRPSGRRLNYASAMEMYAKTPLVY